MVQLHFKRLGNQQETKRVWASFTQEALNTVVGSSETTCEIPY